MDYFLERNIVEIKGEYTTFLINIMTPFIYEGIRSVYKFSLNAHNELVEKGKHDAEVKSPGVLKLFQVSLKEIPTLNNNSIEIETNRIKAGSKCADWFDDLVKAVIKSNIILLTFANSKKRSEILKEQYHNKVEVKDFVHKCYIECARVFYNNPELFWHEFPPLEIKRNQREACELITKAIQEAIRKMLPIKLILKEYLQNDYLEDNDDDIANKLSENQYMNVQSMLKRDLHGENDPSDRVDIDGKSVLVSEDLMAGGNPDDYSDPDEYGDSEQSEDVLDDSQADHGFEEDYGLDDDYQDDTQEGAQEGAQEGVQEGGDTDDESGKEFLDTVKGKLEAIDRVPSKEQSGVLPKEPPKEPSNDPPKPAQPPVSRQIEADNQARERHPTPPPQVPSVPQAPKPVQAGGVIPKAVMDEKIKSILNKSNVTAAAVDRPKSRMSKRDAMIMKEIEGSMKPKMEEPDRKIFFEQYMK